MTTQNIEKFMMKFGSGIHLTSFFKDNNHLKILEFRDIMINCSILSQVLIRMDRIMSISNSLIKKFLDSKLEKVKFNLKIY
jgi:hypothetical protein